VQVKVLEVLDQLDLAVATLLLQQLQVPMVGLPLALGMGRLRVLQLLLQECVVEVDHIGLLEGLQVVPGVLVQLDVLLLQDVSELLQWDSTPAQVVVLQHHVVQPHPFLLQFLGDFNQGEFMSSIPFPE